MILLCYLAIFLSVLVFRRHYIIGAHIKPAPNVAANCLQHIRKWKKGKHGPYMATVTVGLPLEYPRFLSIRREKWYHRFLKVLGLAAEAEMGDEKLDRDLFFVSETPEAINGLVQDAEFRESIKKLFGSYKIHSLHAFGFKIWIRLKETEESNASDHLTRMHLEPLEKIAAAMKRDAEMPSAWSTGGGFLTRARIALAVMGVHAAALAVGISSGAFTMFESMELVQTSDVMGPGMTLAALSLSIWAGLLIVAFARSGWMPLVIADFIIVGFAGFVLSSFFLVRAANMTFDHASAQIMTQPVIDKPCQLTCRKGSGKRSKTSYYWLSQQQCSPQQRHTIYAQYSARDYICASSQRLSYHVMLKKWSIKQDRPFTHEVELPLYDATKNGDNFIVPVHPGAFGIEWIDRDEVKKQ